MKSMPHSSILPLKGAVRHYEWGGFRFIPELTRINNPRLRPFAELWFGDHPAAPSSVRLNKREIKMDELMSMSGRAVLGKTHFARYNGRLPYLFKVLDVREMLSIQVHPDRKQAENGFFRENAAGIRITDQHRNYRDPRPKPEMQVALTDFWLLCGFRSVKEIRSAFLITPEFKVFAESLGRHSAGSNSSSANQKILKQLYRTILAMPQQQVSHILHRLHRRIVPLYREQRLSKESPDFWAARAFLSSSFDSTCDRGIFLIYLLNLIKLRTGQGVYLPAGIMHAYLEGVCVELMANSDNVLRGGLTRKHVDQHELLRVVRFKSGRPKLLRIHPLNSAEQRYSVPTSDFQLTLIRLKNGGVYEGRSNGAEILLSIESEMRTNTFVSDSRREFRSVKGSVFLLSDSARYRIKTAGPAEFFKAGLPS